MALNVTLKVPYTKKGKQSIMMKEKPVAKMELDLLTRLIVAEAGNQPVEGQQAVANVVMNRLNSPLPYLSGGKERNILNVIQNKNAFESYTNKKVFEVDPTGEQYKIANDIAKKAIEGKLKDNTKGATHFINPNIVMSRSGKLPSWYYDLESRGKIGDHEFFYEGIRK